VQAVYHNMAEWCDLQFIEYDTDRYITPYIVNKYIINFPIWEHFSIFIKYAWE
jgi:hypothetical protein